MRRSLAPDIVVHIDALDLSAVPRARQAAVAAAFTRELEALLVVTPPSSDLGVNRARLSLPHLTVDVTAAPERLGVALARAVHDGLSAPPALGAREREQP